MRQKILNHTSMVVILSIVLTFLAASVVLYGKFASYMREGVRGEAEYIQSGLENFGIEYLSDEIANATGSRITLIDEKGIVLYDNKANEEELLNHGDRPEITEAKENGIGETIRYSQTLEKQTFYYAVLLKDGKVLRVSQVTESLFSMLFSSFTLLGLIVILILLMEHFVVQKQTKELIRPINELDLEHPLKNVCYEELRPLLVRVDQQNRQIARQVEELKAADEMRREFSANVSHELKTPLMSISGYAELMMNGMVPPEHVEEFSGRIYHEASRLTNLVTDIIQLSRLDEKHSNMQFEIVDLYELSEDIIEHLKESARKKNINLLFEGEKVSVRGVRHILYEMFYNLADNAIRYTEADGCVKVTMGKKEGSPFFCVEDNGIGIPEKEQTRIFERFYRVDKSHSRQTGGTGLGLSIVKHGAALHHAKINLESTLGKGTKMELVFKN